MRYRIRQQPPDDVRTLMTLALGTIPKPQNEIMPRILGWDAAGEVINWDYLILHNN